MAAQQLRTHQGETLDALCWRHYGRTAGVTEAVLEANPGIAEHGPLLPQGVLVFLPDAPASAPERQVINLWN
ncbi:tail protein X [Pseudomonas sp. C9-3]|uniref:tail protein X n=1 Tax=Pseudomonas sp. C9-3 TaxID=3078264 RepID=UPI0028E1C5BD|nr:tail protein X [Pseudomonas sp. C9-3]